MIKAQRFCQLQGHEMFNATHICTCPDCDQSSRWACVECFYQQTHQHNQITNKHIINQQQFKNLIEQVKMKEKQINKETQVEIQFIKGKIGELIKCLRKSLQILQDVQSGFDNYRETSSVQFIVDNHFYSLNNSNISYIINKQNRIQQNFDYLQLLHYIQSITILSKEVENQLKILQYKYENQELEFTEQRKFKYDHKIYTAQISSNESYLAFGGYDQKLVVFNLNFNKELKSLQLDYPISRIRNYCMLDAGRVTCIALTQKMIFHKSIEKEYIKQIFVILFKNKITSSQHVMKQIYLLLIQKQINQYQKQSMLIVIGLMDLIMIVCDLYIKFFNAQSGLNLIKQQCQVVHQLRLINSDKLLTLNQEFIQVRKVNYVNKELMIINEFNYQYTLHRFHYINSQEIIIICDNYILIIDDEFKLRQLMTQSCNFEQILCVRTTNHSENYLIICGLQELIAIRKTYQKK